MRRKRLTRQRNGKLKFPKLFLIPILLIFLIAIYFLINSSFFSIKQLNLDTKNISCTDEEKIKSTANLLGKNIIFANFSKAHNDLKKKFICIRSVNFLKNFPDKVNLQVLGRDPVAILVPLKYDESTSSAIIENFSQAISSNSAEASISASPVVVEQTTESYLVDKEGIIFAKALDQTNIPKLLIFNTNLKVGQKLEENLITNSLTILEKIKVFGIEVSEAKIYSKNLLLINAFPKIIFKMDEKKDIQLASLQLILNQAKIDKETLEFIDLRFDKPIVRIAPKK